MGGEGDVKISTHLLPCGGWFCPVASKIVILKENGVVNGVVKGGK